MRRKIYSKMLKKRQQKSSMRLCNGVILRKWMQNKSHHHVHESRTFSKRSTWCKETLTSISRALTKRRHELISRHCPQTLTTRIVRKLNPRDSKHIRNQLWCDRNARTSNVLAFFNIHFIFLYTHIYIYIYNSTLKREKKKKF